MKRRTIPTDPAEAPEEDLRSRSDDRRDRVAREEALLRLAVALIGLPGKELLRVDLPESVLDVVMDARKVRPGAARNRIVRLVRAALRDMDADVLARTLERVPDRSGR